MVKSKREESVFQPGGADRLLKGIGRDLTDDERALLLAVIGVDAEKLDEKGLAALEKLKEQVEDYNPEELAQAVKHIVTAEAQEDRKLEWPEVKRKRRRRRSSKK
jgi:predicted house-cleaning noncanonical NTP pyrophosphatase (MazG superfamily)